MMGANGSIGRNINGVSWLVLLLAAAAVAVLLLNGYLFMTLKFKPAQIVVYDGPPELRPAYDYKIQVNKKPLFVYNTAVNFN